MHIFFLKDFSFLFEKNLENIFENSPEWIPQIELNLHCSESKSECYPNWQLRTTEVVKGTKSLTSK